MKWFCRFTTHVKREFSRLGEVVVAKRCNRGAKSSCLRKGDPESLFTSLKISCVLNTEEADPHQSRMKLTGVPFAHG